ncbi:MAG: haloacid dehalogenase-like hydrolase [Verrucomicrobiales bacterium]|nr:haloacid dehalogenase-like hydrolase [Verrucomicrobiales bacterium]
MKTELVLFDIDGTLIRTGGAGVKAFGRAARLLYGVEDPTRGIRFHGRTDRSIVREFLTTHGFSSTDPDCERFLDAYGFLLDEEMRHHAGEICPGVGELIEGLRGWGDAPVLGLLTGNIRLGAGLKLRPHGLAESFVLGAFGDDHHDRNELARIALDRGSAFLGRPIAGESVVVIGDTRADIECARAIGARCVAVATGGETLPELLEHSPALALESLAGVPVEWVLGAGCQAERPVDWDALYREGDTRWDHGEAAPGLVDFLSDWPGDLPRGRTVSVPGCGRGHDARAWASAGFEVVAEDLSASAIREALAVTPAGMTVRFVRTDFLDGEPGTPVDWLFEHTLFCAIPPSRRSDYVRAVERRVRPGGHYLAINYLQPSDASGPPFGATVAELRRRWEPGFELVRHWVPRSFESRRGRERMFVWRRRF